MQLTVIFKIEPNKKQKYLIDQIMTEYIKTVNETVDVILKTEDAKLTSKNITSNLPSAVKNQAIRDSKTVVSKYKKSLRKDEQAKKPVLKKPVCIWNNQNYRIVENTIRFPVMINGKSSRLEVDAILTEYQLGFLKNKLGTLRIVKKSDKYIAQISVEVPESELMQNKTMGVDLGLKVPAVAVTEDNKTKFCGNGRKNKYIKRKFRSRRKKLGKSKKLNKIKDLNNKEQRYMKDQDHKVSREIVDFAEKNNVSEIRLEQLQNIRNTARTSRKNEKNLHTWSFYRLAMFIEYKATLKGIKVQYVNPKYTSQKCPNCGKRNHARDRKYNCSCGFKTHRDRVGAINIINAPVIVGNRQSA